MPLSSNKPCNRCRQVLAGCCIAFYIGFPVPLPAAADGANAAAPAVLSDAALDRRDIGHFAPERASIRKFAVTPVADFPVGEYLVAPLGKRAKSGELDGSDKVSRSITERNRTLHWQPVVTQTSVLATGAGGPDEDSPEAARNLWPAWGLQISVDW